MKVMHNNILSSMWLINFCLPDMRAKKDGSIIIVSSIGGVRGTPVIGAYGISKAADMQLARNLAVEYGKDNIRVNTIAPGLVKTRLRQGAVGRSQVPRRPPEGAPRSAASASRMISAASR